MILDRLFRNVLVPVAARPGRDELDVQPFVGEEAALLGDVIGQ
jgi:hypothetical protein